MSQTLADAVLQRLRGSACAALFGDTWNPATRAGTQKFFGDYASAPAEPYLVLRQGESREYLAASAGNYRPFIASGTMAVSVFAAGRLVAEQLADQVAFALNDFDLIAPSWPGCNLMLFRLAGPASFVPTPETGPGTPTVFVRLLTFQYQYSGAL